MKTLLRKYWFWSLVSGLTLWLAWPPRLWFILLFVAFIPLLWIEARIRQRRLPRPGVRLFGYTYLAFLVWNGLATWWIWNASPAGSVAAIILNSLFMTVPWLLFTWTRHWAGNGPGYISLAAYWISLEYLHHQWELAWPWLSLGNGLSAFPQLVQWYEYSGIFGGSAWILGANILLFLLWRQRANKGAFAQRRFRMALAVIIGWMLIPAGWSLWRFQTYRETGTPVEAVAVQPNINAWHEKFPDGDRFIPYEKQLERLIRLTDSAVTPNTRWVAWPETSIPGGMDEDHLEASWQVRAIRQMLNRHPGLRLVTGIDGYRLVDEAHKSAVARPTNREGLYWEAYNTALFLGAFDSIPVYHKSRLVPGVERMPYPQMFRFLESFAIDLGGISGSLGTQKEPEVFFDGDLEAGIAPVICYESVFGGYVARYIRRGANVIFVITNDDWWGRTDGHRQHLLFSSLRAIETRKDVLRSANTGISCRVDQRGIIHQATGYRTTGAIRVTLYINSSVTFYLRYGNWLARVAVLTATFLFLITLSSRFTRRFELTRRK